MSQEQMMPLLIKNTLYRRKVFWQLKSWMESHVGFGFWSQVFKFRLAAQEEKISARILWASLPSILLNTFYAILFIVSIEIFNHLTQLDFPVLDKQTITVLLSTIVTVCGVFLGLYFTAVSAVAGNMFMRATDDLQSLFIREQQGRQYVKTLVVTTVVGVLYLLLGCFNFQFRPLGPILIALLSAYAVIRFMLLGSRVFYFLRPLEASAMISGDAARAIDSATARGFRWQDPTFQNHYQRLANTALRTMRSLIDFGIDVMQLSDQQLVAMAKYIFGLLRYYSSHKKAIPCESFWYKRRAQFQNWMLADATEIMFALNTGTFLTPKTAKDGTWFEEGCIDTSLKLVSYLVGKQKWEGAQVCLESLIARAEDFGQDFYEDSAKLIIRKGDSVVELVSPQNNSQVYMEEGRIVFMDSLGRLPISP